MGSAGPSGRQVPSRLDVDRFVLPNGLEVWHQERPHTGTVSLIMVVRVGARHETRHNNGISHFLEHMLFDGTERWDEHELREVIRQRGGYYNALTSYEYTAYEVHLLAGDLEPALDWLAEIVFRPSLPAEKIEPERQVLMQEKGGRSSRALDLLESWGLGYDLALTLRRRLFPGSSLGLRVAGEDESLDRIDREMLSDYHRRHYVPNNMTLIAVGDVPAAALRSALERYLAGFAAGPQPPQPPTPPRAGREIRVVQRGPNLSDRSAMRCGARTVGASHADVATLDVLAEVLSNRLTDEVRLRRALVYSIGAYNNTFCDTGYFVIRTASDAGKMPTITAAVARHLERLQTEPVPAAELAEAKATLKGQFALATQSNVNLAWLYASHATWCRPGMAVPPYGQRIDAVSAEDLLRVAQHYFVPENSYLGVYRPAVTAKTGALGVAAGLAVAMGVWLWQRGQPAVRPA